MRERHQREACLNTVTLPVLTLSQAFANAKKLTCLYNFAGARYARDAFVQLLTPGYRRNNNDPTT